MPGSRRIRSSARARSWPVATAPRRRAVSPCTVTLIGERFWTSAERSSSEVKAAPASPGAGAGAKPRLSRGGAGRGEKPADDARTAEEASGRPPAGAVMRADMGPRDGKRSHWSGCGGAARLGRGLGLDWRRPLHGGGRSYGGARLHGVARRILARQSGPELFRHRRQFRLGRSERRAHGRTEHHPAVRTPNADELTGRDRGESR